MQFITVSPSSEGSGFIAQYENKNETAIAGATEYEAIGRLVATHGEQYSELQILRKKE